ncbi:MAG TPA: PAS domain S-box protein, partial [Chloroflexota bacterium]|nr:PAS domain S-box protein [Chloroflexota bacterium]
MHQAVRQDFYDLFRQAPAAIAVHRGPEHIFEFVNPQYLWIVGRRDPAELLGKPVRQALPELAGQGYVELGDRVYATGEPFVGTEMPAQVDRLGDGTLDEGFFNFVIQPSRTAEGEVDGVLVYAVEVTEQVRARRRAEDLAAELAAERDRLRAEIAERRQVEAALRESETRQAAIVETALDGIITMDDKGTIVEFNQAAEQLFGYRCTDVLGRTLAEMLIPPALRERHRRGLAHYLATGEGPALGRRLELSALRADQTEFPVELSITRIRSSGPPLFTGFVRDLTDRKRAETQVRALNADLERRVAERTAELAQAFERERALREVTQALAAHLDERRVVELAVHHASGLLGAPYA